MDKYEGYLYHAISWAKAAGVVQLDYFRNPALRMQTKQNVYDVVTEADKASELLITDNIIETYPTHSILSEESGVSGMEKSDWRWVIDPLDGTTNYSQGLPVFAVSIALQYKEKAVMGVVYAPYLGELFHAIRGGGAFLNGKPIHCASPKKFNECVLATGMPYDKAVNPDNNLENITNLATKVRGIRRLGSAAIDLCYLAAGFFDGYWELNLNPWDVEAGKLIAEEAGIVTENIRKARGVSLAAAPPALLPLLLAELR